MAAAVTTCFGALHIRSRASRAASRRRAGQGRRRAGRSNRRKAAGHSPCSPARIDACGVSETARRESLWSQRTELNGPSGSTTVTGSAVKGEVEERSGGCWVVRTVAALSNAIGQQVLGDLVAAAHPVIHIDPSPWAVEVPTVQQGSTAENRTANQSHPQEQPSMATARLTRCP